MLWHKAENILETVPKPFQTCATYKFHIVCAVCNTLHNMRELLHALLLLAPTSAQQSWWWADDTWIAPDLDDPAAIISLPYSFTSSEAMYTEFYNEIILFGDAILCLGIGCSAQAPPAPPSSTAAPTGNPDIQMTLNFPPPEPSNAALQAAILDTIISLNPNTGLTLSSISLSIDALASTVSLTISGQTLDISAIMTLMHDASFLTGISGMMNIGSYTVAVPATTVHSGLNCPTAASSYDPQTDNVWWTNAVGGDWSDPTMWSGGRPEDAGMVQASHT